MTTSGSASAPLALVASRVRARRSELSLTLKQLAERSGLSPRFLSDVESGKTNISVGRLGDLAGALDVGLIWLLRPVAGDARASLDSLLVDCTEAELRRLVDVIEVALGRRHPKIVALLGIRGAGKSTVGADLSEVLDLPFVELAGRIEARAAMSLGDIFTLHGEAFYREIELSCFADLVQEGCPCVVALPGGIVTSDAAQTLLRSSCTSVWLRATAEVYWDRVFAQGDTRPMAGHANAMADLRSLVKQRNPLYARADLVVDTAKVSPEQVVAAVVAGLEAKQLPSGRGPR